MARLDRLEMLERLAAGTAAPECLAGGRAERGEALGVLALAARTGECGDRTRNEAKGRAFREVDRAGRNDAVAAQLGLPRIADPVARPGRGALHPDPGRAEAGVVERGDDAR